MKQSASMLPLSQVGIRDIELVGDKNASLGEMIQYLRQPEVNVPDGFVIHDECIRHNNLAEKSGS